MPQPCAVARLAFPPQLEHPNQARRSLRRAAPDLEQYRKSSRAPRGARGAIFDRTHELLDGRIKAPSESGRAAARRSRGGSEVTRLVVDAMHVIGARPSWWRDRPAAARALIARLQHLVAESGERVSVVLEGRPLPDRGHA